MGKRTPDVEVQGTTTIRWMYPKIYEADGARDRLAIALYSVRAANDLVIEYNSARDGWVVLMQPTRDDGGCMEDVGPLREVAFVPAWIESVSEDAPDGNS